MSGYGNVLPIYKGHFVDIRLKQFHFFPVGKMCSIIPFDSPQGQQWLKEMREQELSMVSVPIDSKEGQKRMHEWQEMLDGKKSDRRKKLYKITCTCPDCM